MIGYEQKLARVLDSMGGVYLLGDILKRLDEGRMQSHVVNNSWAITEIVDFPRARQLHVLALVGDAGDLEAMHGRILTYARDVNAGLISAYGRRGWLPLACAHGWRLKAKNYLYHRDL